VWGCRRQLSITACLKGSCCFPSIFRGCCPRHTTSMVHLMVKQGHLDASCHTKFVIGVEVIPRHWQRSLDGYMLPRRRTNVRVLRKQNAGTQCSSRGGTCDVAVVGMRGCSSTLARAQAHLGRHPRSFPHSNSLSEHHVACSQHSSDYSLEKSPRHVLQVRVPSISTSCCPPSMPSKNICCCRV
jgi:hypothetical protein